MLYFIQCRFLQACLLALSLFANLGWAEEKVIEPVKSYSLGLDDGGGAMKTATFSPDGNWIAAASVDRRITLWDANTGEPVRTYRKATTVVEHLTFSPDSQFILIVGKEASILRDINTDETLMRFVGEAVFSPDGQFIFGRDAADAQTQQWRLATRELVLTLNTQETPIFFPDGQQFWTTPDYIDYQLWAVGTPQPIQTYSLLNAMSDGRMDVLGFHGFSPDKQWVALQSFDEISARFNNLSVWDIKTQQMLRIVIDLPNSASFSPDGQQIVGISNFPPTQLININTGQTTEVPEEARFRIGRAVFTPDGQYILFQKNNTLNLWDINQVEIVATYAGRQFVSFSPDGQRFLALSGNDLVLSGLDSSDPIFTLANPHNSELPPANSLDTPYSKIALSPNRQWLALVRDNSVAQTYQVDILAAETNATLFSLIHTSRIYSVTFSDNSARLLSESDEEITVWDINTGTAIYTFLREEIPSGEAKISPDGQQLVIKTYNPSGLKLLSANDGNEIWSLDDSTVMVDFSPNGATILSYSLSELKLIDVATGDTVRTFDLSMLDESILRWAFQSFAFSVDGDFIFALSAGRTLEVWHTNTGNKTKEKEVTLQNSLYVNPPLAVSRNGQWATTVIAGGDEIALWALDTGELVRTFKHPADQRIRTLEFSLLGNFIYATTDNAVRKWASGLGALREPDNHTCVDDMCKHNLPIAESGFYVAEIKLPANAEAGQWGLSISNSSGTNPGGFSAGSVLRENGEAPAFIGFYLNQPSRIALQTHDYFDKLSELRIAIKRDNQDFVYGPVTVPIDTMQITDELAAGYYVVTVSSPLGAERSYFGIDVTGEHIQSFVDVGGMIDHTSGLGFIGVLITEPQNVTFNLFYGGNYHTVGAGGLDLALFRMGVDNTLSPFWSRQ